MVTTRRPRTDPKAHVLGVWANGMRVGTWSAHDGTHELQYDDSWTKSPAGRRLSRSLPFTPDNVPHRGEVVRNYFDNLLPDSDALRRRIAERFGASNTTFDLLAAIGRDCVGAVQLLPPDATPAGFDQIESRPLNDAAVEHAINAAIYGTRADMNEEEADFRISIAGAQEKTALLHYEGKWRLPLGTTPTTHIIKLPIGLIWAIRADMTTSVENEWLCGKIMSELGFEMAASDIATFGERTVLVVERFDRQLQAPPGKPEWIARLPQEDFCQALGVPVDRKYENEGGPGIRDILRILQTSTRAEHDTLTFALSQLAFWLLAATDGHAKNFSIFHERGGGYHMTPLYDVISMWPIIGEAPNQISMRRAKLSMALRGKSKHYVLNDIHVRHWQALAAQTGAPDAFDRMVALVMMAPDALDRVEAMLPAHFPKAVFTAIRRGVQAQATRFVQEL